MRGLSLVVASGGYSSSQCAGLSLSRPLLLRSTGSRHASSVVVAHEPSCSAACGIFPDQGSNPCLLHWQADSQPLCHQGSPKTVLEIHFDLMLSVRVRSECPAQPNKVCFNICVMTAFSHLRFIQMFSRKEFKKNGICFILVFQS